MLSDTLNRRYVVLGGGSIGKRHIGNLQKLGVSDIVAVDPRQDRRIELQERFSIQTQASFEDALSEGADVVLICSPSGMHRDHALLAAKANCHMFIEKPLADSLEGLDTLIEEIEARKLVTLVGCNFRFHPGLQHVKKLIGQGVIGRIVSARAQFGQYLPDWHPWEDYRLGYSARSDLGGGVLLDRIHELDYMTWLLGDVKQVAALVGHLSHLEIDTEDTADLLVKFENGAFGTIHLDYVRRTYDCCFEVVGDQGTIQWSYAGHTVNWYLAQSTSWQSISWPRYDGNDMYLEQARHLLRALSGEVPSVLDANGGRKVLHLALSAKQAAKDGRVVNL